MGHFTATNKEPFLFEWDYQNRLRTVTRKLDSTRIAVYSYDAAGRRIRKVVGNSGLPDDTTIFYLDGWREIEERNGADTLRQQYVYGVYIDEPLVLDRNLNGDNTAIGSGDQRLFYHQNTLYSVFALTDATGKIVEGYQYDAYGRQTVFTPGANGVVDFGGDDIATIGGTSSVGNLYFFTGRRFDGETLLYHYSTRFLDSSQGRFISRNTVGYNDGINLYEYVNGSVTMYTDPSGQDRCCVDRVNYPIPNPPVQTTAATPGTATGQVDVFAEFRMEADFIEPGWHLYNLPHAESFETPEEHDLCDCRCYCCEYRQYVRGTININRKQVLTYAGGALSATEYQEDKIARSTGGWRSYGHRKGDENIRSSDEYLSERKNGCFYRGHDAPGSRGIDKGTRVRITFEFLGVIEDVCQKKSLASTARQWTVTLTLN